MASIESSSGASPEVNPGIIIARAGAAALEEVRIEHQLAPDGSVGFRVDDFLKLVVQHGLAGSDIVWFRAGAPALWPKTDSRGSVEEDPGVLSFFDDRVQLDQGRIALHVGGETVGTTILEFRLLEFLMQNAGTAQSRDGIFEGVWKRPCTGGKTLDVHIKRCRDKLTPYSDALVTVRNFGYMFDSSLDFGDRQPHS